MQVLPAKAVAAGTLSSLATISGQVATTDLQPGEQLLASRFVDPASLEDADQIEIPTGMQQLSVSLEPPADARRPCSLPVPRWASSSRCPRTVTQPAQTHLVLHQVLVTKVEGGIDRARAGDGDDQASEPGDGHGDRSPSR